MAPRRPAARVPGMRFLVLTIIMGLAGFGQTQQPTCNHVHSLQSRNVECERRLKGQTCTISDSVSIVLKNKGFTACYNVVDRQGNHVLTLTFTLEGVTCTWQKTRAYYTFPVTAKAQFSMACPTTTYCDWGSHCLKNPTTFPGLTREATSWPGITGCMGGPGGQGCLVFWSQNCMFFRWYLIPDYTQMYEVSKLGGATCSPMVQVAVLKNHTWTKYHLKEVTKLEQNSMVLGIGEVSANEVLQLEPYLIQHTSIPQEVYVEEASTPNQPKQGRIGDIQAMSPETHQFTFDEKVVSCQSMDAETHCIHKNTFKDVNEA